MIELYTATTPNGRKVSIALEEMGLDFSVHALNLKGLEQKAPCFLQINPNGRIPAIIDREEGDFAVFESGAILIYLAEKTGTLMPTEAKARSRVIQWLMWQVSGLGPMQGQANVFFRYWPEKIQSVIDRFQNETRRLFTVMDTRLAEAEWLAGDYSIADIACYPWIAQAEWSGVAMAAYPDLARWFAHMGRRPAVIAGMLVPTPPRDGAVVVEAAQKFIMT